MKRILMELMVICLISTLFFGCNEQETVTVPILMFHDVKSIEGGTWSISEENFRKTLELLLEEGYEPVSFEQLVQYVDGEGRLPNKPVCITLDDGYYSSYARVLPIVKELKIPVTVFMTCATLRDEAEPIADDETVLQKMTAQELSLLASSPFVSVQSHSYGLHSKNTTYGQQSRDNALPLPAEVENAFKAIFSADCAAAEAILKEVGVAKYIVYSYPSGKSCDWAEEILKSRGYRASVTTNSGKRNCIRKGDADSLFSLGRMNVNDETTVEALLQYLERK